MVISEKDLVREVEQLLESNNVKIIDRLEESKIKLVVEDDGEIALVFIELVSKFGEIPNITETEFKSAAEIWLDKNKSYGGYKVRFDWAQLKSDDDGNVMQCRYTAGQSEFVGGDTELKMINSLISMTLIGDKLTESQMEMVGALRKRRREINEG